MDTRPALDHAATGLLLGVSAYALWGLLPLYLKLVGHVPAMEVLAHRVLWSLLLLSAIALVARRLPAIVRAARGRTLALLCLSATLIATNWLVYLLAVQAGHVLEASLGYFINPLVSVALGVAVLGERIGRVQRVAVALALVGVLVMVVAGGGGILVSLALAFTFAGYGLVRKLVAIDALGGLLVETALLAAPAMLWLWLAPGGGTFGADRGTDLLLAAAGPVTTAPLLMFAAAARRLRLATLGLLQYLAPTLQLAQAVLLFGEPLRPHHLAAFAFIWAGLLLYAWSAVQGGRPEPTTVPE